MRTTIGFSYSQYEDDFIIKNWGELLPKRISESLVGILLLLEWVRSIFIGLYPNKFNNTITQTKDLIWSYNLYYRYAVAIVSRLGKVDVPKLNREWSIEHLEKNGFLEDAPC